MSTIPGKGLGLSECARDDRDILALRPRQQRNDRAWRLDRARADQEWQALHQIEGNDA